MKNSWKQNLTTLSIRQIKHYLQLLGEHQPCSAPFLRKVPTCPAQQGDGGRPTFAVPVEDVQGCNEEFMCVLLFITRQVPGVCPHQVQQLVRNVWGAVPRVKLFREKEKGQLEHLQVFIL